MPSDKQKIAFAQRFNTALERMNLHDISGEGFSQMLARRGISVSSQTISNWRIGKHMPGTLQQFEVVADMLGIDPGELAFGRGRVAESAAIYDDAERLLCDRILALGIDERGVITQLVGLLQPSKTGSGKRPGRPRRKPGVR